MPNDEHVCNGTGFQDAACVRCHSCKSGEYRNDTCKACNRSCNQYVDTQIGCSTCTTDCVVCSRFSRAACTGDEFGHRPCAVCGSCAVGAYRTPEWWKCTGLGMVDTQVKCENCSGLSCGGGKYRWAAPRAKRVTGAWVNGVWKFR
mmetsp:Transcript_37270/g.54696  ORF Transcript_37270/g.54696 Transcript_37270/m.54696 type:complete len:146 (-) Transcript_37270:967-1404(-)